MEWTDGMEYQLTKIVKTHHCGRGEVVTKYCLAIARLNWTVKCFLASYPGPCAECSVHGRLKPGFGSVDVR